MTTFYHTKSVESLGSKIKRWATNENTKEKQANAANKCKIAQKNYDDFQKEYAEKITTDNYNLTSLNETKAQL